MLTRLIGEQVALDWRPAAALWPVRADPAQIDQILINLCVNARDAVHENGRIEISTANVPAADIPANALFPGHEGDCVRLTVRDNGVGMDPAQQEHIFEPFYTTKASGKGTGLGLPMVYGIVRQNGGFIDVVSAPGQGTAFHVYLPRHEAGTESTAEPETAGAPPSAPTRQTVLLVEDEPSVLAIVAEWLDALGYHVRSAVSPAEAIRLAREIKEPIDLLLTDVIMPGMNGRDLAQTLRTLQPGLRVLFMSGYSSDIVSGHGILDEDAAFIPKPFDQDAFVAKVRQVLAEPAF